MFCKNCGNELCDEAYVCPKCGRLVEGKEVEKNSVVNESEKNKEKLVKIFLTIAFTLMSFAFFFIILGLAGMEVEIYEDAYGYVELLVNINDGNGVIAFTNASIALGFGIAAFVMGLKRSDKMLKWISILGFIASLTMQSTSFWFMVNAFI